MEIEEIRKKLIELGNKERAEHGKNYLKSPYNLYGNKVPDIKLISKELRNLDFYSALNLFDELWTSGNHEEMWIALNLLSYYVKKYPNEVWEFMMKRIDKAKTWDLTDELSSHVLSPILAERIDLMKEIKNLSENRSPWIRRISIISNIGLIKKNKIDLTLRLAEKLIYDEDMYVQKGAGWMLREVGKKNRAALRDFIMMHLDMKPYAFSYATEKMTELRKIRKEFLKKEKEEKHSVIIKKSKIQGKGVFADKDFNVGEIVIKWNPKILEKEDLIQLLEGERKNIIYLKGKYLLMREPENKVNHSCNPNTSIKDYCDIAITNIKKGEEITSNYSGIFIDGETLICNCGSKNCRKIIT